MLEQETVVLGNRLVEKGEAVKVTRGRVDGSAFKARFIGFDPDKQTVVVYGGRGFNPSLPLGKQKGVAQFRTLPVERVQPLNQKAGGRPKYYNPWRKKVDA